MGLTVITPPVAEPVSLKELKQHSRIDIDDEDSVMAAMGVAAREYCEVFLDRQFVTATWQYTIDIFPIYPQFIYLPRNPVQSIVRIQYIDTNGVRQTLDPAKYQFDNTVEPARLAPIYGSFFPITRIVIPAVFITFTAGYGDPTTVPQSIKHAIKLLAAHYYQHREASSDERLTEIPRAVQSLLYGQAWGVT